MTEERKNEFHNVVALQIRFNDVDKFGHVNNTIYFQFYDSGKTDYVSTVCKGRHPTLIVNRVVVLRAA